MPDDYIDYDEAARYLSIDVDTLTSLLKNIGLPLSRIDRGERQVSRAALDTFIESCKVQPGTLGSPEVTTQKRIRRRTARYRPRQK